MDENNIHDSDFALLYPDVNKEELLANEEFNLFAGSRLSAEELSEVYRGYLDLTERIRKREMEKAADILAKKLSSVGALNNSNPPENTYFTREQVKGMSRAEIKANYEKIRKSQEKWQ
ncbi:MAG: hypothetical protein IJV68_02035 [Clostridia bacterium]|nr:hypothetical protein [Clostridia bacterium]MBQ9703305.1 hypothetical protein [Clostridia bacterium]